MSAITKTSLLAGAAALAFVIAGAAPAEANMRIGNNNNITTNATVRNAIATAIGNRTHAYATVAGINSGGDLTIGNRNNINLRGSARNVIATAIGNRSVANANVGGITSTGSR